MIVEGITTNTLMILFFVISTCYLEKIISSVPQRLFPKNSMKQTDKVSESGFDYMKGSSGNLRKAEKRVNI